MFQLHLSENLIRLRRDRKITQEELADFIGVTKAAVSKWENAQTTPDILLLPRLASFFDVTIDRLLGYEAQLSREQIRRCYMELCQDFANLPFSEVWEKVRSTAHRYYSCYPLLLQLCVLYLNHFMLAETKEDSREMLKDALRLCSRILEGCRDTGICADAAVVKAMLHLQLGVPSEAIELLEPTADVNHLSLQSNAGALLIQAHLMSGNTEKARDYAQVRHYLHLLDLVSDAIQLLLTNAEDFKRCRETMRRTQGIIDLCQLEHLHPNLASQYYYQAAVTYAGNGDPAHALEMLQRFEHCVNSLLSQERIALHGDDYFDRLEQWMEQLPLGDGAPRNKAFVRQNAAGALSHPAFSKLKETPEFRSLYKRLSED